MEKFLAQWRQDALNKHQHDAAIFIGDKLLALTNDDKDAFWLAQVHFSTGNFTRAQRLLAREDLVARNASCRYLLAHCLVKQLKFDEALAVLGDTNPTHLIAASGRRRRKLQHSDGNARPKHAESTAGTKTGRADQSEERDREATVDLRSEAAMCYLRGLCYAERNAFDRATACYKDAVLMDVQCFEAFDRLMRNSLMSPDEEWDFLEQLDFDSITVVDGDTSSSQEAAEFTKMLYITRLSKYKNALDFAAAAETLSTHYRLAANPDLLLSKAELLFTQCRFQEALTISTSILSSDKYNFAIYPLHLACLHEVGQKNALFLISHDLADHHPEEPASWLAVGVYYLSIGKVAEARRFFSKSSMMDPHFGPAWIGFAHTFAAEGEHDQAISAYSNAARLFQGTHLPQLFLGMQNLSLNNMSVADDYLQQAYTLCKTDPLLLNEMGVVFYHKDQLHHAVKMFTQALELASAIDSAPQAWLATRSNLGHAYRRLGMYTEALAAFSEVLCQGGSRDPGVFCAQGLVLLELHRPSEAVTALHLALSIGPQDPVATDLLGKALMESSLRFGRELTDGDPGSSTHAGESFASSMGGSTNGLVIDESAFERKLTQQRQRAVAAGQARGEHPRPQQSRQHRRSSGMTAGMGGEESMMEVSDEED